MENLAMENQFRWGAGGKTELNFPWDSNKSVENLQAY